MKTLIIRLSSLGDVLLASTVVRALKRADPNGTIDICTRPAYDELFAAHPAVRSIIPYDERTPSSTYAALRREEIYDCVVDLHNNFRTRRLRRDLGRQTLVVRKRTFERWLLVNTRINLLKSVPDVIGRYMETLAPLGIEDDGGGPEFFPAASTIPSTLDAFLVAGTVIGVCPGARHFTKRFPAARYVEVCRALISERNARIVLFGGDSDRETCALIAQEIASSSLYNACDTMPLSAVALAMDRCVSILTNDSGLMHVAAARQRPVIAIFGSTVRAFGFVPRKDATVLEVADLSCRPCSHIGRESCPKGHFKCMNRIEMSSIVEAVMRR